MCWHQLPIQGYSYQHTLELLTDSNRLTPNTKSKLPPGWAINRCRGSK